MKRYQFKSLRARLTALLILPVSSILLVAGFGGFFYARHSLIRQWNQSITLQLGRAAHEIEMRLSKPVELMTLFSNSGTNSTDAGLLQAIVERLETLPGVVRVNLKWHAVANGRHDPGRAHGSMGHGRMMNFKRGTFTRISPPTIDQVTQEQTVSMTMILMDASDTAVGNLEIVMKFSFLVTGITNDPLWQSAMACIVDRATGRIVLASALMEGRTMLGQTGNLLEESIKTEVAEKTVGTLWEPGHPPDRVAGFHSLQTFPWSLVVFADGKIILSPIIKFRNGFAMGAFCLVALIVGIIHLNIGRMSETIRHLARRAITVAAGDYGEKIPVSSRDEIGQLAVSFNTMIEGLREKEVIQQTFGRYIDPDFARILLKQPEIGRLGGRRQDVAVLMADIRGFTTQTEHLPPEAIIEMLNGYFGAIIPLIQQYQGIIVDFVGDGILTFFEPIDEPLVDAAHRCLQCAFDMHAAIDRLNQQMKTRTLPPLHMGVGINSGAVVVGNIGSETRKKYGIVGSVVNLTQRIQSQANAGEVMVSGSVFEMVEARVRATRDVTVPLKGVSSAMQLYAIVPDTAGHPTKQRKEDSWKTDQNG